MTMTHDWTEYGGFAEVETNIVQHCFQSEVIGYLLRGSSKSGGIKDQL